MSVKNNWDDMEFSDKLIYAWEIPVDFIREVVIPPTDEVIIKIYLIFNKFNKKINNKHLTNFI